MQVDEAGERQIDLLHLGQRDRFVGAAQAGEIAFVEGERDGGAQARPLRPVVARVARAADRGVGGGRRPGSRVRRLVA